MVIPFKYRVQSRPDGLYLQYTPADTNNSIMSSAAVLSLSIHLNAARKSTNLRQIGLLTIMTQCWSFVPAENAVSVLPNLYYHYMLN